MAKQKSQPEDTQYAANKQAEVAAGQFDPSGPAVQEIGDFIVVDAEQPEGAAKAAELDAAPLAPHDVSNDAQAPADPANSGDAVNTPAAPETPGLIARVETALQTGLEALVEAVRDNAPSDGTVTLDFGKAGKLTGCLKLNTAHGPGGPEHTIYVPVEGGYFPIPGVPDSMVSAS